MHFERYLNQIRPVVNHHMADTVALALPSFEEPKFLQGGKRLRAGVLLMVSEAMGIGDAVNQIWDLACAIEFAHAASLIVDDMIDEDDERRGVPTLHVTQGQKRAMLDTVGVLSIAYSLVAVYGERYVTTLASTQRGMVRGVVEEIFKKVDLPATRLYDSIISLKTGQLFGLAARWGGMIAGVDVDTEQECYLYGLHLGKAMQIADDIVDIRKMSAGEGSKIPGSELLLLWCVTADGLVREAVKDVKDLSLYPTKIKRLLEIKGVGQQLEVLLGNEITACCDHAQFVEEGEWKEMMLSAPREIADMMLGEV